jgi:hypothetical protein
MLDIASRLGFFLMLISNVAFRAGSSKQGKARRAFPGSNWVVASHLHEQNNMDYLYRKVCYQLKPSVIT